MLVELHLIWLPGQVLLVAQCSTLSSEVLLSLQSLTPLQSCVLGIHRKLAQVNSPSAHGGYSETKY